MKARASLINKLDALATVVLESFGTFLVSIALTKFLSPEDRGRYSTVIAALFLISFLGSNVHNRAVYFRYQSLDRGYMTKLFNSLIFSTTFFSMLCFTAYFLINGFTEDVFIFGSLGAIGLSIFNFLIAYLSSLESHKSLRRFSLLVFLFQMITVSSIVIQRNPISALMFWLASLWVPIILVGSVLYYRRGRERFGSRFPSRRFIKHNLLPRLSSLPVYVSIFDALKIDVLLCTFYIGYEGTGNYVVATTFSVSIQFIYRFLFLSTLNKTIYQKKSSTGLNIWKNLTIFVVSGAMVGVVFSLCLQSVVSVVFPLGYQISRVDFLLIWAGNLLFWGRRLIGDFMLKYNFDKVIGISEFIAALCFVSALQLVNPENLHDFSIIYFLSLAIAFIFILIIAVSRVDQDGNTCVGD